MSLPNSITGKINSIPMNPIALANDLELAYMLSFSPFHVSNESVACSPRDTYHSPLSDYSFVDFQKDTFNKLHEETTKNYEHKNATVVKSIRSSFKEFYARVAAMTYTTVLKEEVKDPNQNPFSIVLPTNQTEYKIDQMRGNNPNEWPRNLNDFHKEIMKLPWNAFACEPEVLLLDFINSVRASIRGLFPQNKKIVHENDLSMRFCKECEILLGIALRTNNQTVILQQLSFLTQLEPELIFKEKQLQDLLDSLEKMSKEIFENIPLKEEISYHLAKKPFDLSEAFMIMKKIHFQKQNGLGFFTVTTDGNYLYVYVSAINGGMYKIGTGKNGTVAGKIYLEKDAYYPVGTKLDEVNWVYLKGKLYLKSSSREPYMIEIINPETFKHQSTIQLRCEGMFGHHSLINLNRNSILLTDGESLYFLGKELKIAKPTEVSAEKMEEQKQQKPPQKPQKEEQDPKGKKKKKKNQPEQHIDDNSCRVVSFVLYEFNFQQIQPKEGQYDEDLSKELFLSFNNYFSKKECRKALWLANNDIMQACQWLVEQGEKERSTKICYPTGRTIIAEAEITNGFPEKNLKGSNQITTKETSLLHIQNVSESLWTMDRDEITCYSENGVKVFSKNEGETHFIGDRIKLATTHIKTFPAKFSRNPEYTIVYDPYNSLFYTYTWPCDGYHYFPTAVLVSSDYKSFDELSIQKKKSLKDNRITSMNDLARSLLLTMSMLENTGCPENNRINDWLWFYGQKIIKINQELNQAEDKKPLSNKKSKYIAKMNKVNDYDHVYKFDKKQLESKGKITKQIIAIPPFSADGSYQNLKLIKNTFGKTLAPENIYNFLLVLESWLEFVPKVLKKQPKNETLLLLGSIRDELSQLLSKLPPTIKNHIYKIFIENFFYFFPETFSQNKFFLSLPSTQLQAFISYHYTSKKKYGKSMIYTISDKEVLQQKYESKSKFEEIFLNKPNLLLEFKQNVDSLGFLLLGKKAIQQEVRNGDKIEKVRKEEIRQDQKNQFFAFLEEIITQTKIGIKFFEFLFTQSLRLLIRNKKTKDYVKDLELLFVDSLRLFEKVLPKQNLDGCKNISQTVLMVLQIYYISVCSLLPNQKIIESLMKILEGLERKEVMNLLEFIQEPQLEGISQTSQKVYETPHPLERGKSYSFIPFNCPEASLIFSQFDKRCQSDPNHDVLSIQITHEGLPVGNSISCNDGTFLTNLRLSGKVEANHPYLIMGNSVTIDFSSSSHAKDANSFGRYGFKFGMRPIFTGRIKYKANGIEKILGLFKSKTSFEEYLNTVKFATVTVSSAIEHFTYLEKQSKTVGKLEQILCGKIFKEGYEQYFGPIQKEEKEKDQEFIIDKFFQKTEHSEPSNIIMKHIHGKSYEPYNNENVQRKTIPQARELWDMDGIPTYIRGYLVQIRNFAGDFVNVFKEARKLALPVGNYGNQLRRRGFTQQYKQLWLQGQAILFLTVLKHSGLLHLNLKFSIQYIKENLKAFQEARNGIFEAFISRMQTVRQWRDLVLTFREQSNSYLEEEKKQEKTPEKEEKRLSIKKKGRTARQVQFSRITAPKGAKKESEKDESKTEQKVEDKKKNAKILAQKTIRERLVEPYMIKAICNLRGINFINNETYENVSSILKQIQKEEADKFESVYIEPINHLIRSCLFLLKLKSPSTQQNLNAGDNIVPPGVVRSLSQDNRNVNTNKVNLFREWLENWKKWKDFCKEAKVQLKFPVTEIVSFVNSWIPIREFQNQMETRTVKAEKRKKFYEYSYQLIKLTANYFLSKYALGSQIANIQHDYKNGLESVPFMKVNELKLIYKEYANILKEQQNRSFSNFPLTLNSIQRQLKENSSKFLKTLRQLSLNLYLIESENPQIDLNVALFFISLKGLTILHSQLSFISSLIVQKAYLRNHSITNILKVLNKEIGKDTISSQRWRDYLFTERVLFLLKKLEVIIRDEVKYDDKVLIAETLFYLIFHLEVPIIIRFALRLLKKLKIPLHQSSIKTPYDITYQKIPYQKPKIQKGMIEEFNIQNQKSYNNVEIMTHKCYELFHDSKDKKQFSIKNKFKDIELEMPMEEKPVETYNILLNLHQEEDIAWIIQVLYYLEQMEKTMTQIKNWEEYLALKVKKKQNQSNKKEGQQQQQPPSSENVEKKILNQEKILINIPNSIEYIDSAIEQNLPCGWFLNYNNVFNSDPKRKAPSKKVIMPLQTISQPAANNPPKKGKNTQQINQGNNKRPWNPVQFIKVFKKFEDLSSKALEEPKEEESDEIKNEFVKAKNFITRMRKHCLDASIIMSSFSQYGYYLFKENVGYEKCQQICALFTLGGEGKLKPIPCEFKTKDYGEKLSPAFVPSPKKSMLRILFINSLKYDKYEELTSMPQHVSIRPQSSSTLYFSTLNRSEYILSDEPYIPFEEYVQVDFSDDPEIEFGREIIQSNILRMKKKHEEVRLKQYPNVRYFISQGGLQSGIQNSILVSNSDPELPLQKSTIDNVFRVSEDEDILDDPEELIHKAMDTMEKKFSKIESKSDLSSYLLLICYLKKISKVDLNFIQPKSVKKFGEKLYHFSKSYHSSQSIESYEQQTQRLIAKLLDSEVSALSMFRLYRHEENKLFSSDNTLRDFVIDNKSLEGSPEKKKPNQNKQQIETHQYPKSKYLLPNEPPIPEQNKLLKYWEKNIIPRIYDFVKTTLRPLQMDDFFEQIRIQLRKNNQMTAKQKAYVICDNKLPAGAVLPDANHNWDSLALDEITVGQDVLIRLPKSKSDGFSPFLSSNTQDYRLGQVIFVDIKNLIVLVKHRLQELGIFCFSWVPVNILEPVHRSIVHYSVPTIYQILQECLKGNIYNYSKICLTKLAEKVEMNQNELMQETIIDMLRDDPISGWSEEKQWPLKSLLKKMLREGNTKIIDEIEKKFCPIESYDVNLYSEEMIPFNRFKNALGLILSFKKESSLIWYSSIKFFADPYGYKEIDEVYACKNCLNEISPIEFRNPDIYCKYISSRDCLKVHEQNRYEQKEILATVFSVDPIWTVSCYLAKVIGELAVQEVNYLPVLTRLNRLFISWLQKRPVAVLAKELCRLITKLTTSIIKVGKAKNIALTFETMGTSEQQVTQIIQWITLLQTTEEKQIIILYSTLLQNLSQAVAAILGGIQAVPKINIPVHIKEMTSMMKMILEIEKNRQGKDQKIAKTSNEAQWERILTVENIPKYINSEELRENLKKIVEKNHGKLLAPDFDVFCHEDKAVILVEGWDITELVEEQVMEKIQQEQEKEEEQQEGGGLLMQWSCPICTFINPMARQNCEVCDAPAPAPEAEVNYEKIQSADVDKAFEKLKEKEKKYFQIIKEEIANLIGKAWEKECEAFDKKMAALAEEEQKTKFKRKKGKVGEEKVEEKKEQKPLKPDIALSSGSTILGKDLIQTFLKNRFLVLPEGMQKNSGEGTYLEKFKQLMRVGYDLWGDNIVNQNPSLLSFESLFELMRYIQNQICKGSSSILSYNEDSIRLMNQIPLLEKAKEAPINFTAENNVGVKVKYQNLAQQKSYNIRYSWKIIKELNKSASKCLQFINMDIPEKDYYQQDKIEITNSLGLNIKCLRGLVMNAVKLELFQKVLQKTSVMIDANDAPKVTLERLKISREEKVAKNSLISPKQKDQYMFTKAHEQLENASSILMRPFKPKGTEPYLSFGVTFKGELVMGQAGPYRQFFTDISTELQPNSGMGLFIPTPNNEYKIGEGRSRWSINPKANTTYHYSLFEWIGLLMGCCIRTGTHMSLDLATFYWKMIAGEDVTEKDYDEIDKQYTELMKQISRCPSEEEFASFEEVGEAICWIYQSVDGTEIKLRPEDSLTVEYDDRQQYVQEVNRRRIEQCLNQVKMIRKGLIKMIPKAYINHLSGEQLKIMVCGIPKVDVDLLKKHTKYTGQLTEQSPRIVFFWEMMRELEEEDKLKFIRFCWGQERLPLNSEEFQRNGIRFMIKPMMGNNNPKIALPKADTCFFNIQLPDYPSKELMKEKILLAINLDSVSINADQMAQDEENPLMGNVDYEDEGDYEQGGGGG